MQNYDLFHSHFDDIIEPCVHVLYCAVIIVISSCFSI